MGETSPADIKSEREPAGLFMKIQLLGLFSKVN